ncbi:hypothetical protein GTY75_07395 [Streptomyces sp. SID8381]|uniref:hypothetical protein n=1 Tax=unclassified Streptomyces TaxID=2593676 RepID=UPI00036A3D23|nr:MULTISPECIES: hypothetical protein [unclassified Streptomyces]MYX26498.1 hypothetical protein [Streptomyces sp. SID8381]
MVSSSHEAMHRIFQDYPGLFSRVSEALSIPFPRATAVSVLPNDVTETKPVDRRIDTLLRIDTQDHGPFLLAVEAQKKKDPEKPASWGYYLAYLRSKYRLPPLLLVVCQDRATAEWATRPEPIGFFSWPSLTVRPIVAGPHNMPVITDPEEARADLALTALAAITHAADPDVGAILKALSTALRDVPEDVADPIIEFTAQGLGDRPAKHLWRNLVAVDLSFYKSYLSEEIRDEGRAQGRAEDVLLVLEQRGLEISEEVRRRVTECDDLDVLRTWLTRAVTVAKPEDIFGEG